MITVVIPIYNTAAALEKCFSSIASQTYTDFEVVMVDDGSTDDSSSVCHRWEVHDHRFRLLSQANCGVSAARNNGIDHARGEYLCFVDSDDYVEPDYLAVLHQGLIGYDADICMASMVGDNKEKTVGEVTLLYGCSEIIMAIGGVKYGNQAAPWNKLIKKTLLNGLRFDEHVFLAEDHLFNVEYAKRCKKGVFINMELYHYDLRTSSTSYMTDSSKLNKYLTYADAREQMLRDTSMLTRCCRWMLINGYFRSIQICYYQARYFYNRKAQEAMLRRMAQALKCYPIPWHQRDKAFTWWMMAHFPGLFPLWNAIATKLLWRG